VQVAGHVRSSLVVRNPSESSRIILDIVSVERRADILQTICPSQYRAQVWKVSDGVAENTNIQARFGHDLPEDVGNLRTPPLQLTLISNKEDALSTLWHTVVSAVQDKVRQPFAVKKCKVVGQLIEANCFTSS